MMTSDSNIPGASLDAALTMVKAMADPTRLRLLALASEGMYTVSELTRILGQSQPRVSRHLKLLCDAGLIDRIPEGAWVFYRAAQAGVARAFGQNLAQLLDPDDPELQRDRLRLDQVRRTRQEAAGEYFRKNAGDWNRIRSLYIEDSAVESAILAILGKQPIRQLVDIGTGTGRMLELLAEHIDAGIGIDMSRDMLALARAAIDQGRLGHCHVRQGDMYALPVEDASADLVTLHQVLHYADAPEDVFAEMNRILQPGGRALVIDFAPHEVESLRKEHQHRRLGFARDEIAAWGRAAGTNTSLTLKDVTELRGDPLTVTLWLLEKS